MNTSTQTRAITVAAAVAMAASGVMGGSASAVTGTTCTPTTRTIDTLTYSTPLALSPRGHVVAEEGDPGANPALWLHRPNGSKTTITFDGGAWPHSASDVSGRGVTVGSDVRWPTLGAFRGWISKGGAAQWLPDRTSADSFMAQSVNASGAVVGVDTDITTSLPGKTDFFADPILWPTTTDLPQSLSMPDGVFAVAFDNKPLISIRNDGSVSAVLEDYNAGGTYLARWATAGSAPTLVTIPYGLTATDVAGRWVVGRVGSDMFVFSPKAAVRLHAANALTGMHVSANGTYSAVYGPGSIFGRGTAAPRDGIQYGQAIDIVGSNDGTALRGDSMGMSVLSCTLGVAEATSIDVTPIVLG